MVIKSGGVISGISKDKSAQVTVFIIIGILILFSFAGIMYFTQVFTKEDILIAEEPTIADVPTAFKPLQTYTDSCLTQVGESGLLLLGEQGGYIYPNLVGEYSENDPTDSDGLDLGPIKIPFWHYNKNPNNAKAVFFTSLKPKLYTKDDDEMSIEVQLSRYVEEKLDNCLNDYEPFFKEGFDIEILDKETKDVTVTIGENSVNFWLKMEVDANKGSSEHVLEEFYIKVPLRLKHYYEVAEGIAIAQQNQTFFFLIMD